MTQSPDAIIIGTGVIGAATAFEMAKAGWKTLSLDRNSQIGHGSTEACMDSLTTSPPRLPRGASPRPRRRRRSPARTARPRILSRIAGAYR